MRSRLLIHKVISYVWLVEKDGRFVRGSNASERYLVLRKLESNMEFVSLEETICAVGNVDFE